ncbi:MAG: sodium:solute symporter, partial [Chitinophagaceae bacterium]
ISRRYSLFWGVFSVIVAFFVTGMGSLIEAVNILGSLFYGVILGIFLVAFYVKRVGGKAVFWSAVIAEFLVILVYQFSDLAWLWLNVIGTLFVVIIGLLLEPFMKRVSQTAIR